MEEHLEQYIILAKNAKGKAQEKIAIEAVSNANTFVFGELLPLLGDVSEPYSKMLEIFAYGTIADYEAQKANLPEMTPAMLHKLQLLTLASLAANSRFLPYETLMSELRVSSVREVEDLIIQALYSNLIEGRLDHKLNALHINTAYGRDVPPQKIAELTNFINEYLGTVTEAEQYLSEQIESATKFSDAAAEHKDSFIAQQMNAKEAVKIQLETMLRQEEAMQRGGFMGMFGGFNRGFLNRR